MSTQNINVGINQNGMANLDVQSNSAALNITASGSMSPSGNVNVDLSKDGMVGLAVQSKSGSIKVNAGTHVCNRIYYKTTAQWNAQYELVSRKGVIYIYSDHSKDHEGRDVPGFKVGDGNAYLIDVPFMESSIQGDNIICDTMAGWASKPSYQTAEGILYVYTDYKYYDGKYIPGLKVGTGNAYLADTPFVDQIYADHIENSDIHITAEERLFWNNKVTCYLDPEKDDKLIFSKE